MDDDLLRSRPAAAPAQSAEQKEEEREEDLIAVAQQRGPAEQQSRRSYLKMARNDDNLSNRLMKAQLYGTGALLRKPTPLRVTSANGYPNPRCRKKFRVTRSTSTRVE